MINDIKKGSALSKEKNSKTMDMETELYFSKDEVMTLLERRYKRNQGKYTIFPKEKSNSQISLYI